MRTTCIIFLTLFFVIQITYSQSNNKKILIAKYTLYPYSTEYFDHDDDIPKDKQSFDIALRRTKTFKYTLISDFQSKRGIFFLDSIITTPIKGKESYWIEPENVTYFAIKDDNRYYKKESIFEHYFYTTNGEEFSYDWKITEENKIIAGLNCTKAISEAKNNIIIVWFTNEIPINYGPLGLNGLPGLILQAETFFNTITIDSINYLNNDSLLTDAIDESNKTYNKEKLDNELKESILMLKKGQLIRQLKSMR